MYAELSNESLPKSYWRYRNAFLIIQAVIVAAVLTTAAVWAFHDGKVVAFSVEHYEFAKKQFSVWF